MKQIILKYCIRAALPIVLFFQILQVQSQWVEQNSNSNYWITALYFFNENTGIAGTSVPLPVNGFLIGGEILRTTNGGVNWQRVLLDSNLRVKSFYFIDQNTGFAIGGSYASAGKIIKTTNSGLNWFTIIDNTPPVVYKHFYNLYFANENTGFASNLDGVYRTTNAGINWQQCLIALDYYSPYLSIRKLFFFDLNKGLYLSDSGKVYKTTNSGSNWSVTYGNPEITYRDINFLDNNTGYAVGFNGLIIKTTNQGLNWQQIDLGTTESFYSIRFSNALTGYLTKAHGVLKTTDGGLTWPQVLTQINDTMYSNYFINSETGYTGGSKGRIFKTTTGGVTGLNQISTEIPSEYSLQQNYPNPFNPSTIIKFSIPQSAFVNLAIYDMLGKKVDELVNGNLKAGYFEVNWNAEKFSSGIYLYKLSTDNFNLVKKMTLIK